MNIRQRIATVGAACLIVFLSAAPAIAATATKGDYDGDGKADIAVFRPSSGTWFIIPSLNPSSPIIRQWGTAGDIPVPADYDGDGITDIAVFRPSNGTWYIIPSSNPSAVIIQQWGTQGDIPVAADYDGDGKADIAVWRPSNGIWYIIPSTNPGTFTVQQWGTQGDIPVPADYDGDVKDDIAVWRPSSGTWFIIPSGSPGSPIIQQWGTQGDIPVPADYDGDGKADIAVWRPSSGTWFTIRSIGMPIVTQWGISTDVPLNAPVLTTAPAVVGSTTPFPVFAGDPPTAIPITVTNDAAGDVVTVTLTTDLNTGLACTTATCGSFSGSLSTTATGTSGGGSYSVTYTPPPAAGFATQTVPALMTHSSLNPTTPNPFDATDSIEVDPAGAHLVSLSSTPGLGGIVQTGSAVRTLAATVQNDTTGVVGVTFVVLKASGYACDSTNSGIGTNSCGTLGTPSAPVLSGTMSTTTVTYTPPATLPSAPYDRPQIKAFSNADNTQSAIARFQLSGTPPPAKTGLGIPLGEKINSALAGSSAPIIVDANVGNDTGNSRTVTWMLTSGGPPPTGVNCSPQCGTLGTPTPSGNGTFVSSEITYTPPATYPGVTADQTPTITATSVDNPAATDSFTFTIADEVCGTGHESVLSGQYAFLLRGGGATAGYGALIGSFTADGAGHITGGLLDQNTSTFGPFLVDMIQTAGSSYTVGPDNRVCMTLTDAGGSVFNFRAGLGTLVSNVATQGRMILFNDNNGRRLRLSGVLMKQDTTSFANSQINGSYAFGEEGVDGNGGRFAGAGVITANGLGGFTNFIGDFDDAGTVSGNATGGSGTYNVAANGRGTSTTTITILGKPSPANEVFYMVSSSEILFMTTDFLSAQKTILSGELKKQTGPFTATTLDNKNYVIHEEGLGSNGGNATLIAQVTFTTNGNATYTQDGNDNGVEGTEKVVAITLTIASSNGRTTVSAGGGNHPPIIYLIDSSSGFLVGTDPPSAFGFIEMQTGGPFSNASLSGQFFFGGDATNVGTSFDSGTATFDGAGNVTGNSDHSGPNGLGIDIISPATGGTYSFSTTSTPQGKGTVGNNSIAYAISSSKVVFMSTGSNPKITIVQK